MTLGLLLSLHYYYYYYYYYSPFKVRRKKFKYQIFFKRYEIFL